MEEKAWEYSSAGRFHYISLTQARLKEAVHLFCTELFAKEKLSMNIGLSKQPDAVRELGEIVVRAAVDGVSLAVIDRTTAKLVACQLNKIQIRKNLQTNFFEEIDCTHPASKMYLQFNSKIDSLVNLFDVLHTNCYFEIRFMAILPQFQGKGIERKLMELALQTAQCLRKKDNNVRVPVDSKPLSVCPIPTAVINVTGSSLMKEICRDNKYGKIREINFYSDPALSTLIDRRRLPKIPPSLILSKAL